MPCHLWRKLFEQCYEAETAYVQAVRNSYGLVGVEFDQALQRADEARQTRAQCEEALLRHEQMHDCLRKSDAGKGG